MRELPLAETELDATLVADPTEPHLVLWNTERFYGLRPETLAQRVRVDHHAEDGRLIGSLVGGTADDGTIVSGFSAPFGGIDVAKPGETVANVEGLVETALAAVGHAVVEVRAKPPHYGANDAILEFALLNQGFEVAACELNFFLDLGRVTSVGNEYAAALKPAARKMLRRSEALGLDAFQVPADDEDGWAAAYEVLRRNRVDRGRPMRLPLAYVQAIRDAFPGRVRLLVLAVDGTTCAAALVYRVAAGRDLVQYWGDALHSLSSSPMNLLVKAVVEHSNAAGAATIDIGISSEDGVANHGLVQFKRSVGCQVEPRLTMRRPATEVPSP